VKKVLAVVVVLAGCTGLLIQPALARHRHHYHWGHGSAAMGGNNANSAGGSNSAVNIKGGNSGFGR
jgi:FAD/FMN-containing dehydrogenase